MKEFALAILGNWNEMVVAAMAIIGAASSLLLALYTLFLMIPGEQPDKVLKAAYEFTMKYSNKKEPSEE